jgi:hypothetical protein
MQIFTFLLVTVCFVKESNLLQPRVMQGRNHMYNSTASSNAVHTVVSWVMTPCSLMGSYQHSGEIDCLHLQGTQNLNSHYYKSIRISHVMLCFQSTVSDNGGPHYALPLAGFPASPAQPGPSGGKYGRSFIWAEYS